MSTSRIFAAAAFLSLGAAAALAEPEPEASVTSPWVEMHASRVRLLASEAKTAGGARLAGLEIVLDDGWKTYWRMPGDAGVPPQHDWSGSVNAAQVKVLYPAPKRIPEAGGEVIGYKGTVLFPIEVTPQDPARPVALKLALELGVCREICVAATAKLDLMLPPAGKAAQRAGQKDAIAAALERVPRPHTARRPADPKLVQVSLNDGTSGARLIVQAAFGGANGGDVFVEAPDGIYVPMLRKQPQAADGTVRFTSDLAPDLVRDLKGKALTLTLVSEAGASEAQRAFP
ncbi:MAG: protein-disulfide reductase DsbD domain-containing protein [Hyphomicrobiaceae bacterium]